MKKVMLLCAAILSIATMTACKSGGEYDNYEPQKKDGKWGLVDTNGLFVVEPIWDGIGFYGDGIWPVERNGKCGAINTKGEVVVALEYEQVGQFVDGVAPVKQNNHWGYVDKKGKLVIPLIYDSAQIFCNGVGFSGHTGIVWAGGEMLGIRKDGTTFPLK